MFKINISNHPNFPDITRKAEMIALTQDSQKGKITMEVQIEHYLNDLPFTEYNRPIKLLLNNTAQYPTGEMDAEGNPVTIGDYDYFTMQAEAGASLKSLVEGGVMQVDSTKVLDIKCAYKDVPEVI